MDIILVVLIIFMLTSSLIISPSVKVELPKASLSEETSKTILNISIDREGVVLLNGDSTANIELLSRIQTLLDQDPATHAVISADTNVTHGAVISVMDTLKKAGVNKVAMSVK